jgi:NAD(P) transhydrogenase
MDANQYDLVVIGSGPAGQKGAVSAAKMRKKVAIIDRKQMIGGVCVNTGTIPSKTLREAVLYLSGYRVRAFYGRDYMLKDKITMQDLNARVQAMIVREMEVIRAQLRRNQIQVFEGSARFLDAHTVEVSDGAGQHIDLRGEKILVACGTRPAHSQTIPLDGKRLFDADQLPWIPEIPREAIVVGAGVIGLEYASMLAALGVKVTLLDQRPTLLDFVDREIIDALAFSLRRMNVVFRLGEKVVSIGFNQEKDRVEATLESGKVVHGETLLYAVGRVCNTDQLNIAAAGLKADDRGRLKVNDDYQTEVEHIYAAGDVIGFPALASTSMEQGRIASLHAFGKPAGHCPAQIPYGIYAIPEISTVGKNEEELTKEKVPYEVGIARYAEIAKAQMLGDENGMLKILFHRENLKLLGVHCIGERAAEIVHIGQAVMAFGGTIEYFRDTVFNYPTLGEAYKTAALDGFNKL